MVAAETRSTRDRLLDAAIDVFVEQGFEGARLQDIARGAGLTTGAIYANFRGKSELLFDAMGTRADTEFDTLLAQARGRDMRELLGVLGDQLVAPREQVPLLLDAVAAGRRDPEIAGALRHRLDAREHVIVELVERAKAEGAIDPDVDAAAFARFCIMLAMGAVVMRTLRVEPPGGAAWHDVIARLLDAIGGTGQ
jgi:AcrR family transcriptional regulator